MAKVTRTTHSYQPLVDLCLANPGEYVEYPKDKIDGNTNKRKGHALYMAFWHNRKIRISVRTNGTKPTLLCKILSLTKDSVLKPRPRGAKAPKASKWRLGKFYPCPWLDAMIAEPDTWVKIEGVSGSPKEVSARVHVKAGYRKLKVETRLDRDTQVTYARLVPAPTLTMSISITLEDSIYTKEYLHAM